MDIGNRIMELRRKRNISQSQLAKNIKVSREIISRYERNEAIPSIEIAKRIADTFDVSLDYLVGEGQNAEFDKMMINRLVEIEKMKPDFKTHLLSIIDSVIRDYKSQEAYSFNRI
jgi:transcriptional regulator with XRE-family HTH domain